MTGRDAFTLRMPRRFAALLWLALLTWNATAGTVDVHAAENASSVGRSERNQDVSLVQLTLAQHIYEPKALERTEEKLSLLSDEELWVAAGLARRISESPSTAAADIAQFLLAALIATR